MTTPKLGIPELVASQAIPETTVNEALRYLEQGAGAFRIIDRHLTAPPGAPADGDAYLVAAGGTGAWAGHDGDIAFRLGTAWAFIEVAEGMLAWILDENDLFAYDGAAWLSLTGGSGTPLTLEAVRDEIAAFIVQGANITITYDDDGTARGSLEITAAGGGGATVEGLEGSESILRFAYGNGGGGTVTQVGLELSNQGSVSAPAVANTNRLTRAIGRHTRTTGGTAGQSAGHNIVQGFQRDVGFTFEFRGGIETIVAGPRLFIGGRNSSGLQLTVDPSTWLNAIGFGLDVADANIQLLHNDGAGAATKTDTGIAPAAGDELYVRIHCDPGGDYEVLLHRFAGANLTNTPTTMYPVSGVPAVISADIPAGSAGLSFGYMLGNGATAAGALMSMLRLSIRSPF